MVAFSLPFLTYVSAYGAAVLGCGLSVPRARTVQDEATRRGLVWLLVASGGWALFELGFLVAPTQGTAYAAYLVSLVVGLTTVGAWLYFCSAYTGRTFHRNGTYRRAAVAVYVAIVAVKLTNPLHGLYFSTAFVTTPFVQMTVRHGVVHWVVTGLSYALAAVGFFMLYELFLEAGHDTRPLGAVVAVTGLPVVLDIVGFATPVLLDINYEPLGVAVFAVGVLYLFDERFLAVQLTGGVEEPVVYLDDDGRVREYNDRAERLFPSLPSAVGDPFEAALPSAAEELSAERSVLERSEDGETRYYLVSDAAFSLGQTDIGRLVLFSDVTETERQRRELERHNDQLEGFAAAIRHELLNSLQIVDGRVTVAAEALTEGDVSRARDSLATASDRADRMSTVVDDLADLARHGQTPERVRTVEVGAVARAAFDDAVTGDLSLSVESGDVEANEPRLQDMFRNAFEFAAHNDASTVTVSLRQDGFAVTDDGTPPTGTPPEAYFDYGGAVPDSAAGMTLPNLRMLARTQGWTATLDTDYEDGVRIVVTGATVRPAA
ncbi:putative signal-transducing histidine kinase [Halosimplex carlsbadense 2-9-1]|uniref:histidine kinase n=1 Tax=Halosimplex carlsbadense 2-9-1 TaxID=797114 RepID=M0D4K2_9EURY|nr:histidine kinase N-terminal 7TM domain-containing protein [Halosimplex carlsbadense]ELZ29607.1 putative signal-transducing histidine kinase [Halosimplex carlsbadense 2-9-1]